MHDKAGDEEKKSIITTSSEAEGKTNIVALPPTASTTSVKNVTSAAAAPEAERSKDEKQSGEAMQASQVGVGGERGDDEGGEAKGAVGEGDGYPHGFKIIVIVLALCLAIFLVALDQTIIAPALGAITEEFNSVKDIVSLDSFIIKKPAGRKNPGGGVLADFSSLLFSTLLLILGPNYPLVIKSNSALTSHHLM